MKRVEKLKNDQMWITVMPSSHIHDLEPRRSMNRQIMGCVNGSDLIVLRPRTIAVRRHSLLWLHMTVHYHSRLTKTSYDLTTTVHEFPSRDKS